GLRSDSGAMGRSGADVSQRHSSDFAAALSGVPSSGRDCAYAAADLRASSAVGGGDAGSGGAEEDAALGRGRGAWQVRERSIAEQRGKRDAGGVGSGTGAGGRCEGCAEARRVRGWLEYPDTRLGGGDAASILGAGDGNHRIHILRGTHEICRRSVGASSRGATREPGGGSSFDRICA